MDERAVAALERLEQHVRVIKGWVIVFGVVLVVGFVLPALAALRDT